MTLNDVITATIDFVREHETWAMPIVFILAFGESLAFISLLLPATVILLGLGALIGESGISFWPIWAAAVAVHSLVIGSLIGSVTITRIASAPCGHFLVIPSYWFAVIYSLNVGDSLVPLLAVSLALCVQPFRWWPVFVACQSSISS